MNNLFKLNLLILISCYVQDRNANSEILIRLYFLTIRKYIKMPHTPQVVIIGSGAAGYSAACKLLENGYSNITILEAQNRYGGRINSVPFGNGMIDLGAQWCHGEKDNIVYNMVKDLNLVDHSECSYEDFKFIDSKGNYADVNKAGTLLTALTALSHDTEQLKAFNGSFGEYMTTKYEEKLNSTYPEMDRVFAKQLLDWYHKLQNNLNAFSNWFEVSAKGFTNYLDCEGDQTLNWKDKGYKTIFSVLKKEIPDPSKKLPIDENILLNKEVTKIIWDHPNKQENKKLVVECADGSQYKADHVIVTVSLGVLKHLHNTLFVPELPLYKKNAIQGLSFGCVNKVILKFPTRWWAPEDNCGFDFLWIDEDRDKLITEFPEGPSKDGKSWLTAFFGFHTINCNPNVLFGFVDGEFCAQIETLSDDLVIRGCMFLLRKFSGKHHEIPMPDSIIRSSWATNNHVRGSYTFHSMETDRLNTSELAKPLGDNALLFAGEATHSHYYSTVHGAIETGFREAERIISHYKSQTNVKAQL